MFDFDVGKLLLIGVVALIFIPPKDLPEALRTLGRLISQARRMAADFQSQFSEALREAELSDLKDQLSDLKNKASVEDTFNRVASMLEQPSQVSAAAVADAEVALASAPAAAPSSVPAPAEEEQMFFLGPSPHDDEPLEPAATAVKSEVQENTETKAPGAPGSAA